MQGNRKGEIGPFLAHLQGLVRRDDRGALADLRRGFSETTEHRAWPHLAGWCDLTDSRERQIMSTVAAGFALHGRSDLEAGNMGATLRGLAMGVDRQNAAKALESFDGRFRRFLSCSSAEEVCERLPGVLRAAERKAVPVDFARLHRDLFLWGERTKIEWADQYWGGRPPPAEQEVE